MNWFQAIMNKAAAIGEIYIYGEVDNFKFFDEDVTPSGVAEELKKLKDAKELNLYVNSPGGGVFAGVAIYNLLKRDPRPITAYVDGLAASIASLIVLAADRVVMPANALYMIHNPYTVAAGDAESFRALADTMDKVKSAIMLAYTEKTGLSDEEVSKMMDEETWFTGQEAYEAGFADQVEEEQKIAACLQGDKIKFKDVEVPINKFKAFPKAKFSEHKPKMSLKQRVEHELFLLGAEI